MYIRQSVAVAWFMDAALYPIFSSLPPYLANAAPSSSSSFSLIRPNYTCVHLCAFTSLEIASVISPLFPPTQTVYARSYNVHTLPGYVIPDEEEKEVQKQAKKISVENFQCFLCIAKLAKTFHAINYVLRYMVNSVPRGSLRRVASASSSSPLLDMRDMLKRRRRRRRRRNSFGEQSLQSHPPPFALGPERPFPPFFSSPFHDSATVFL